MTVKVPLFGSQVHCDQEGEKVSQEGGGREGGTEGGMMDGWMDGRMDGWMEGGREGGREEGRKERMEGSYIKKLHFSSVSLSPLPCSPPPPPHPHLLTQEPTTTRLLCDLRSSKRLEQFTKSCGCPETCSTDWRPGRKRPPLTRRPVSVCSVCSWCSVCVCVCVCGGGGIGLVKR